MSVNQIKYIYRDTINRRSGLEVFAGVLTIAIATAITIVSLEFSATALGLIEKTIEPTRPVAGIVTLASSSGVFTPEALDRIDSMIATLNQESTVIDGSTRIVTTIEGRELPLLDHAGKELGKNASVWCVPSESALLRTDLGFPLVNGSTFASTSSPRLGVLINLAFLKSYLGYTDEQCAAAVKDPEQLPKKLRLQFPPIPRMIGSSTEFYEPTESQLKISGFFNEKTYPDIIITIDLAALYYYDAELSKGGQPQGKFGTAKAFDLAGLVDGHPLLPPADRPPSSRPNQLSRDELLAFPSLKPQGLSPYSLVILSVADWKAEGVRDRIVKHFDQRLPVEFRPSKSEVLRLKTALDESNLRLIARLVPPAKFSTQLEIRQLQVDQKGRAIERYRIHDIANQADHLIEIEGDSASLSSIPPWESLVPGKKLADSLTRVRKIVQTYSAAIQLIVGLLAACSVFLLATAHVLRKGRDIGLLLSHGARRTTIFSLYLGQVMWVGLLGGVLGLIFALIAAPGLENQAVDVIRSFSEDVKLLNDSGSTQVLSLTPLITLKAAALIALTTILGALLPSAKASFTNPLKSIGSGA